MALRRCFSLFLSRLRRSPPTAENLGKGSSGRGGQATSNVSKEVGPLARWSRGIQYIANSMQFAYKPRSGAIWSSRSSLGSTFKQGTFLSGKTAAHARKLAQKRKLQAFRGSTVRWKQAHAVKGLDLSKGPKLQPHIISCWRLEEYNRKNLEGRIGSGAVAPWWHPCPTIGPAYIQSPD